MRLSRTIATQLLVKESITPQKLIPLPWDEKEKEIPRRTPAQQRKRAEELMKKLHKEK